jgi:hypothetical protein
LKNQLLFFKIIIDCFEINKIGPNVQNIESVANGNSHDPVVRSEYILQKYQKALKSILQHFKTSNFKDNSTFKELENVIKSLSDNSTIEINNLYDLRKSVLSTLMPNLESLDVLYLNPIAMFFTRFVNIMETNTNSRNSLLEDWVEEFNSFLDDPVCFHIHDKDGIL